VALLLERIEVWTFSVPAVLMAPPAERKMSADDVPRGEVYDVSWWIAKEHYTGVGIVVNDTLSVAYTGGDRSWFGVASYRQRSDGTLDGRWAVQGGASVPGTEIATRR
jgi:hypothetical protein